ncbi:hypothetical protein KIH39_15620 [Telmatocola sphagniphila]|uniref:DUF6444 domain-containing protein n=1 Tax=Telmatocola sphagniphila TaxID=1123043 RepID=A0A8E6ETM2_9BACT|nr:DUF6444 domain-containing protein [Telmatocola sphagniphila]QVL30280.1 hypothetical protein KIH39_15620 [Telmatocola sphagniphila]
MDSSEEVPECPGGRKRDAINADLLHRVTPLEVKLNTNSRNFSNPLSANSLDAPPPVVKQKSKRRHGGQQGHASFETAIAF